MGSFYRSIGPGTFESSPATGGPWDSASQHGGPPAALLTRAVESLDPERVVGRITMELLGPVPVGPLSVTAEVARPGRSVAMAGATLHDVRRGRDCARATAWLFPRSADGPTTAGDPPQHGPDDGQERLPPGSWHRGYLDAIEWRWIRGAIGASGPGVVWMRPRIALVDDEPMSPAQRLMCCVDSASGVSAALDPDEWGFLNTELSVHLLRPPEGEWVCVDAETSLGGGSVGLAASRVLDRHGLVARSAQALLVVRR